MKTCIFEQLPSYNCINFDIYQHKKIKFGRMHYNYTKKLKIAVFSD